MKEAPHFVRKRNTRLETLRENTNVRLPGDLTVFAVCDSALLAPQQHGLSGPSRTSGPSSNPAVGFLSTISNHMSSSSLIGSAPYHRLKNARDVDRASKSRNTSCLEACGGLGTASGLGNPRQDTVRRDDFVRSAKHRLHVHPHDACSSTPCLDSCSSCSLSPTLSHFLVCVCMSFYFALSLFERVSVSVSFSVCRALTHSVPAALSRDATHVCADT
eukprot:1022063-Rhodomonas_salina.1